MEYKAIDDSEIKKGDSLDDTRTEDLSQEVGGFIFSKLLERKPQLAGELMTFRDHLLSSETTDSISVWELKDLGYQTAQRIIHASEPLRLMQEINQNFPSLVSSLSRMEINDTIKDEIVTNQKMLPPGKTLIAINGALVNAEDLDLFSLIDIVQGELLVADKILKLKVPVRWVRKLLQLAEPAEQAFIRIDFRSDEFVHYLNNLEEDAMYKRWRNNLNELLMPVFPGQLRYIRKNLYNAVYVIDPASPKGLKIIETLMYYHENNVPIRFGVILVSTELSKAIEAKGGYLHGVLDTATDQEKGAWDDIDLKDRSSLVIRLFYHVKDKLGVPSAFEFLRRVNEAHGEDAEVQVDELVEANFVEEAFVETLRTMTRSSALEIYSKLEKGDEFKAQVLKSTMYVEKLGLSNIQPCLMMNGIVYGSIQPEAAILAMNEELPRIQESVYFGKIKSHDDVLDSLFSEGSYPRYNPQIISSRKEDRKYVPLSRTIIEKHSLLTSLPYLHSPGTEDDVKPITHLLILDLSEWSALRLLQQALGHLKSGSKISRIGIIHNMKDIASSMQMSSELFLDHLLKMVLSSTSRRAKVLPFLDRFLQLYSTSGHRYDEMKQMTLEESVKAAIGIAEEVGLKAVELKEKLLTSEYWDTTTQAIHQERKFLSEVCGLQAGINAVVTNGRVFVQHEETFVAEDFNLLETMEYQRRTKPIEEIIEDVQWDGIEPDEITRSHSAINVKTLGLTSLMCSEFLSDVIMGVSSSLALRSRSSDTARFDLLKSDHSGIVRQEEYSSVQVDAVIDPLSATGQKVTPLLLLLQEWVQPSIRILLNPMNSLADVPLKNFYRFVAPRKDDYSPAGFLNPGPAAGFLNMPLLRTLTMNLDVPEPWLVEPVLAVHDLDNIVLERLEDASNLNAVFELEALMVTGHCFEKDNDAPRGLQLIMGTKRHAHMVDTIVMANLGYFQLKAAPGVWNLGLAPGRSAELYMFGEAQTTTDNQTSYRRIVIDDLKGKLVHLEVVKKKGMEQQSLLDSSQDSDEDTVKPKVPIRGLLKWASDWLNGGGQPSDGNNQNLVSQKGNIIQRHGEVINIFSIASGHLYERFLKIMILSVLKNTLRPAKFWFIKNYLSPQFKDFLPHMATEYGFDYELVTYKWPSWLHKQTEKQRIIWAYKILFLDVIFPISLKKVIFVDADQIVRADMGDLYDMDINGKPLAYTPFCDNNRDMDGYRFWNQGFWREHLRGRPYHISALYVVDLAKFRQTAAGDNLRVFYETLSKDPNSLSNLDQDLPNYAQHTVPIFSLPQEWLWCESWCGNATKSRAKTIDLCNNPMTKEPKLQGARRIVPEWSELDEEARKLTEKLRGEDLEIATTVEANNGVEDMRDTNGFSDFVEPVDLESSAEL
ncbi:hypothetical protein O6H91_23G011200 [Diphasiastrum complanatum]|uniref:Uncharacterized protein n=1 Tax=Diphasiastrum complanatum TaxID=34168 RepID=A0ACC2A834_DIPCM|nr:hypothetical protein O6H91_23G011200 [Diphasiastrum complanatum]